MLIKLELTNFKKHKSLTVDFTQGLQLIKAPNEGGKSSMLEGIAYALFGAKALNLSFSETVTEGEPESSLLVKLVFFHSGNEWVLERKKSGATLSGGGTLVSGQAEVTKFIEGLFNCSASVAPKLFMANQTELRGILTGPASDTLTLIEKLANIEQLDRMITAAKDQLPSGSTKLITDRMIRCSDVVKPDEPSFSEFEEAKIRLGEQLAEANADLSKVEAEASDLKAAHDALSEAKHAAWKVTEVIAKAEAAKQYLETTEQPTIVDLAGLLEKQQAFNRAAAVMAQRRQFDSISQEYPERLDESPQDAEARAAALRQSIAGIAATLADLKQQYAVAKATRITESACGLCGKDLTQVPEVVEKNQQLDAKLAALADEATPLAEKKKALEAELAAVDKALTFAAKLARAFQGLPVEATDQTPPRYKWVGLDVENAQDFTQAIKQGEVMNKQAAVVLAKIEEQRAVLAQVDLPSLQSQATALLAGVERAQHRVRAASAATTEAASVRQKIASLAALARANDEARTAAEHEHALAAQAWEKAQADLVGLRADLDTYTLNNGLIRKMLEARPLVARRLWSVVLGAVSHYFTQVRGVASTVTRGDDGFLVDGRTAKRLSGSTQDALGLAIRAALMKTFLPSVSLLILDEPGAAMDDQRELALVSMVASAGFQQVLLVSHSDVADAVAANIIPL